jgi:putative redox protein
VPFVLHTNAKEQPVANVIVQSVGNFRQQIDVGPHTFYADEPVDAGGDESGPDPYEYLLAALGACTSMTLHMYARRKNIALERVVVRLSHEHQYDTDCETCAEKPVKLDVITRRLELIGNLSDAQRARLREIANRCPIHQTLTGRITIRDE